MADEPKITAELDDVSKEKLEAVDVWVKTLLIRAGVRLVNFRKADQSIDAYGLVNVPSKYVGIIDAMHEGMAALALGQPLPQFTPLPERSAKKVKRRR